MRQYFTQGIDVASLVKFQILICKTAKFEHQLTLKDVIFRTMYNTNKRILIILQILRKH